MSGVDLMHNRSDALANIEQWAIDLSYVIVSLRRLPMHGLTEMFS